VSPRSRDLLVARAKLSGFVDELVELATRDGGNPELVALGIKLVGAIIANAPLGGDGMPLIGNMGQAVSMLRAHEFMHGAYVPDGEEVRVVLGDQ